MSKRARLVEAAVGIIGESEWQARQEERGQGILTVLGLYGSKEERGRIMKEMKKFLMQAWEICQRSQVSGVIAAEFCFVSPTGRRTTASTGPMKNTKQ